MILASVLVTVTYDSMTTLVLVRLVLDVTRLQAFPLLSTVVLSVVFFVTAPVPVYSAEVSVSPYMLIYIASQTVLTVDEGVPMAGTALMLPVVIAE